MRILAKGNLRQPKEKLVNQNRRFKISFWQWLQSQYCLPEFGGWMLFGLALFFFVSATNTLSGWLYVISGVSFALILIGAVMPARLLKKIVVKRSQIEPVSAGDNLWVEICLTNTGNSALELIWLRDSEPTTKNINEKTSKNPESIQKNRQNPHNWQFDRVFERLDPGKTESFNYQITMSQRGFYQFDRLQLLTSSPLGLCRSLRFREARQNVIVYPQVLSLSQCPLIDLIGEDEHQKLYSLNRDPKNANEGMTKTIHPYRWGDPIRLVHWRSSAKLGELRVRELEINVGGQEVAIAIDLSGEWEDQEFEQAVIAAASLYFYAQKANLVVKLWTAKDGMIEGEKAVLETLATVYPNQFDPDILLPTIPVVWLTSQPVNSNSLPNGSRWILWSDDVALNNEREGLVIALNQSENLSKELSQNLTSPEQLNQLQLALQAGL
jgi:uncharacterized protein (DUF58 family)